MANESARNGSSISAESVPEAQLTSRRRLSVIWVIPIVAAIIAGWLVYKAYSEQGPKVEISFGTADGVEAGKTKIKYKDVDVGTVETVTIAEDLSHIKVSAEMAVGTKDFLRENTRFWIVKPRVGVGGVSGLGTLISGAYIAIDPGDGEPVESFEGVEEPPLIGSDVPGTSFVLRASTLGSISRGAPIYYRGVEVGQVLGYELDEEGSDLIVHIFVGSPHDKLVTDNTRFWNASGIRVGTDGGGVQLDVASLQSILVGGIQFDTPVSGVASPPAQDGHEFALFPDRESINQAQIKRKVPFLTYFDGSIRGLSAGSTVEFRGIRLGTVTDISLRADPSSGKVEIPVALVLEPDRLMGIDQDISEQEDQSNEQIYSNFSSFVERGLRAQLETANLITGDLYISLEFHKDVPPAELGMDDTYPVIPSVPTQLEALTASVDSVLKQIANLHLDQLVDNINTTVLALKDTYAGDDAKQSFDNLDKTMASVEALVSELQGEVPPLMGDLKQAAADASSALNQARTTLANANDIVASDSPIIYDLGQTLSELRGAARSIRVFADYLERQPDALIRGRGVNSR